SKSVKARRNDKLVTCARIAGEFTPDVRAFGSEKVYNPRDVSAPDDESTRRQRETDLRLRLVVDNVPIILWAVDAAGVITLSEGKGLAKLGIRPGESVGQSIFDLYAHLPEV